MDGISWIVVSIVCVFFVAIMYKALKEPIDLLIGWVKNGFMYLSDEVTGQGKAVEIIKYE